MVNQFPLLLQWQPGSNSSLHSNTPPHQRWSQTGAHCQRPAKCTGQQAARYHHQRYTPQPEMILHSPNVTYTASHHYPDLCAPPTLSTCPTHPIHMPHPPISSCGAAVCSLITILSRIWTRTRLTRVVTQSRPVSSFRTRPRRRSLCPQNTNWPSPKQALLKSATQTGICTQWAVQPHPNPFQHTFRSQRPSGCPFPAR